MSTPSVEQFDIQDPDYVQDLFAVFQEMHRHGPIHYAEKYGGHWIISGYEELYRAEQDWQTFTSTEGLFIPDTQGAPNIPPISYDPPLQQLYRKILNPYFSPGNMAKLEPSVRAVITELIDGFIESGRCDLFRDFADPLAPLVFFSEIVHIPQEDMNEFKKRFSAYDHAQDNSNFLDESVMQRNREEMSALIAQFVEARRTQPPQDDVIDALLNAEIDGRPLEPELVVMAVTLLLAAGTDTTSNVIASSCHYLAEHPEDREKLIANPDLIPQACEELLRFVGPVSTVGRTVTKDVAVAGQQLCRGDKVWLALGAANRDPTEFPDADRCDLSRHPNRHVAFGVGVHRCLGSNLARLEFRVAIEEILSRIPDFRLADGYQFRRRAGTGHGPTHVPVVFTPGKRVSPN